MLWLIVGLVTFLGIHSVSIFAPAWRDSMVSRLGALSWRGVYSVASIVSFLVLIHGCGLARQEPDREALARVLAELGARGVFVRKPGAAPLDRCIRVTCAPPEALATFAAALSEALAAASEG